MIQFGNTDLEAVEENSLLSLTETLSHRAGCLQELHDKPDPNPTPLQYDYITIHMMHIMIYCNIKYSSLKM